MAIAFRCPTCGHDFQVSDQFAGRVGKCKACKEKFTVPARPAEAEPEAEVAGGYGLGDPLVADPPRPTFTPARHDMQASPSDRRKRRAERHDLAGLIMQHRATSALIAVGVVGGLVVTATLVPGGKFFVGVVLIVIGALCLISAWFAMERIRYEEFGSTWGFGRMFGFDSTFLLFTRWSDMWPWILVSLVGSTFVASGGFLCKRPPGAPRGNAAVEIRSPGAVCSRDRATSCKMMGEPAINRVA